MASFILVAVLAASFPSIDIHKACHKAEVTALPDKRESVVEECVREEEKARGVLSQKWAEFSLSSRQSCTEANGGFQYSYVELLTCIQVQSGVNLDADLLRQPLGALPAAPSAAKPVLQERLSPPTSGLPEPQLNPRLSAPNQ
jgi:hypothetical protein